MASHEIVFAVGLTYVSATLIALVRPLLYPTKRSDGPSVLNKATTERAALGNGIGKLTSIVEVTGEATTEQVPYWNNIPLGSP